MRAQLANIPHGLLFWLCEGGFEVKSSTVSWYKSSDGTGFDSSENYGDLVSVPWAPDTSQRHSLRHSAHMARFPSGPGLQALPPLRRHLSRRLGALSPFELPSILRIVGPCWGWTQGSIEGLYCFHYYISSTGPMCFAFGRHAGSSSYACLEALVNPRLRPRGSSNQPAY